MTKKKETYDWQLLKDKLTAARIDLMRDHPFFGSLLFSMECSIDENCPGFPGQPATAATDGERVIFGPEFLGSLKQEEIIFVLGHEVLHAALLHPVRRNDREIKRWNIAIDIVVNQLLTESNVGKAPSSVLLDKNLYDKGEGLADRIYDLLVEKYPIPPPSQGGQGQSGGEGEEGEGNGDNETLPENMRSLDNCEDSKNELGEADEATKWKNKLAAAAQVAKMAGKLPAGLQRLVDGILQPKVSWKSVLAQFTRPAKSDDTTWARVNRRWMTHGIHMPGPDGVETDEVAFLIDCSGSCWHVLEQFATEVAAMHQDTRPIRLHVIYFDTRVSHHDIFERDDEVHMEVHGGGGTAFSPAFRYMEEQGIDPACCVVLTDLECSDFGPQPSYPVLWVSTNDGDAPWGRKVIM